MTSGWPTKDPLYSLNYKDQYINYLAIWYLEVYLNKIDPSQREIDQAEILLRSMSSKRRSQLKRAICELKSL